MTMMYMEHYEKGSVVEVDELDNYSYHPSVIHMKVSPGSKIKNLLGFAMKKFKDPEVKQITWNGAGTGTTKVISCAEIMKRKVKGLHQITRARYKRIEEYWEPKLEGLDRLKVNRNIPALTILLSKDPLDTEEMGYQAPGFDCAFWHNPRQASNTASSPSSGQSGQKQAKKKTSAKNKNQSHIKRQSEGDKEADAKQQQHNKGQNPKQTHEKGSTVHQHQKFKEQSQFRKSENQGKKTSQQQCYQQPVHKPSQHHPRNQNEHHVTVKQSQDEGES
ncbi:ribonuclease P protein subunit p25-like protein [Lingula anatina]|uniref:Ribonuclease P protein subunit p25-like protein n=1 Tax=Lingula anatina TaxID=7574 RepID=A0A1S3HYT2_LINAN|nr:ribonuclease P protein subunit p25-like protein [Lingula anatina]|eukprot:XP_013391182.1 ribonuclease P protein subunit p25-like protein [Lingula anatina]